MTSNCSEFFTTTEPNWLIDNRPRRTRRAAGRGQLLGLSSIRPAVTAPAAELGRSRVPCRSRGCRRDGGRSMNTIVGHIRPVPPARVCLRCRARPGRRRGPATRSQVVFQPVRPLLHFPDSPVLPWGYCIPTRDMLAREVLACPLDSLSTERVHNPRGRSLRRGRGGTRGDRGRPFDSHRFLFLFRMSRGSLRRTFAVRDSWIRGKRRIFQWK